MPVFCTQCGTQNEDGSVFCDQCGAKMKRPGSEVAAPAAIPPVPPAPPVAAAVPPVPPAPPVAAAVPLVPPAPPVAAAVSPVPPAPPVAAAVPPVPPAVAPAPPVAPAPAATPARPATMVVPTASSSATRPLTSGPLGPGAVAKLVVLQGGQPVREHLICGASVELGRWDPAAGAFPEVDLTEDDPLSQISRRHARLFRDGDRFCIEDLGSTNGTYVGRARIAKGTPQELTQGTEIILGRTFLRFERM